MPQKLPKSVRKYIRKEKARIRRQVLDLKEQERLINELYQKFLKKEKKSVLDNQEKNKKSKTIKVQIKESQKESVKEEIKA